MYRRQRGSEPYSAIFSTEQLYLDKIAEFGHIRGGTDLIVQIADLFATNKLPRQTHVLGLANGHTMWGVAAFRAL